MTIDVELPNGVTPDCPMGALIRTINETLYAKNLALYWFRSSRSRNRANVTINAGIFPIGIRTSVRSSQCIARLVHWEWCSRVGKTERSRQYQELLAAWNDFESPQQVNDSAAIAAINDAPDFASEQQAIAAVGALCDILTDLPQDNGKTWGIHCSRFDDTASAVYRRIATRYALPWERGARRHYICGRDKLRAVYADLTRHGFVVSLCMDAAQAIK